MQRSTIRLTCAVLISFVLHTAPAKADFMDYSFHFKCDSASNRLEVIPYGIYNEEVFSPEPKDCVLDSGRTVRVKMVLGPTYPYGAGGADPSKSISVWVDKALVLSQKHFGCGYDAGPCSLRLIVTARGFEICHRSSSSPSGETCEFTPNQELASQRDPLEFPLANERERPKAGSFARLYAKDEQLCNSFDKVSNRLQMPIGFDEIVPEASMPYEYNGRYLRYTFDINNDGQIDTIVRLDSQTHAHDGDIYFVFPDGDVPTPVVEKVGSTHSELAYSEHAKWVLPTHWSDTVVTDRDMLDGTYLVKNAGSPWWNPRDKAYFRTRYWHLSPYRYEDVTYFISTSMDSDQLHWLAILRPEPDYQVTEMCIFQTVQENY